LPHDTGTPGTAAAIYPAQGGVMVKKQPPENPRLIDVLRRAIRTSGRSLGELGEASGVSAGQLSRFVRGQRSLTLPAAEKLCEVLHLQLGFEAGYTPPKKPPKPRGVGRPKKTPPQAGQEGQGEQSKGKAEGK
jgi:transcriptional regulator with XRE-family HTH domain